MNTSRLTQTNARHQSAAWHLSARSAISTNTDADTGAQTRLLMTSTIEMFWRDGELVIRGRSSAVTLPAGDAQRPSSRIARGA